MKEVGLLSEDQSGRERRPAESQTGNPEEPPTLKYRLPEDVCHHPLCLIHPNDCCRYPQVKLEVDSLVRSTDLCPLVSERKGILTSAAGAQDRFGPFIWLYTIVYQLLQSSRAFNAHAVSKLRGTGYDQFRGEPCNVRLRGKGNPSVVKMMLGAHVDGIIVANSSADGDVLITFPRMSFPRINLVEVNYYTGWVFLWDWERRTMNVGMYRPAGRTF